MTKPTYRRKPRKVPGKNDYPGKHYIWNFRNELHLTTLLKTTMTMKQIAAKINRDFPQVVRLTKNSVVGKLFRMGERRGTKHEHEESVSTE